MPSALRSALHSRRKPLQVTHTIVGAPRRHEVESFIRATFATHYNADVPSFAPNLMLLERDDHIVAATGWRCAGIDTLYLENYLDTPIEIAMARLAGQPVRREKIVEVGNLAGDKPGASIDVILTLARHLEGLGYEWVVFTATRELIGIFARLGLPLLALATADPSRLGDQARAWGTYYDTRPIVVAGKIRMALERVGRHE
jgi:Thermostable hemolysin